MKPTFFSIKCMLLACMITVGTKGYAASHSFDDGILRYTVWDEYPNQSMVSGLVNNNYAGKLTIPASVVYEGRTFKFDKIQGICNAPYITEIDFSNTSINTLQSNTFKNCTNLVVVRFPATLSTMLADVLTQCPSLRAVHCSRTSVPSSWNLSFFGNNDQCKLYVPSSAVSNYQANSQFKPYDNYIKASVDYSFECDNLHYSLLYNSSYPDGVVASVCGYGYTPSGKLVIPENPAGLVTVNQIANNAFEYCDLIQSVTLPSTIASIGAYAFYGCDLLTKFFMNNENSAPTFGNYSLDTNNSVKSITFYVKPGTASYYTGAAYQTPNSVVEVLFINATNFPDEAFRNYLLSRYEYSEMGTEPYFSTDQIENIKNLSVDYNTEINNLRGIEYLTALLYLRLSNTNIASIDLSHNTNLKSLYCSNTQLSQLDLSRNVNLESLDCSNTSLGTLNLSGNNSLRTLKCNDCELTSLTVRSKELLILHCERNQLSSLSIRSLNKLQDLFCYDNQLRSLTLPDSIIYVNCANNNIPVWNISDKPILAHVDCRNNQMATLTLSSCPLLKILACSNNNLKSLDVSTLDSLEAIYCENNKLMTLDLSNNTKIKLDQYYSSDPTNYITQVFENVDIEVLPNNKIFINLDQSIKDNIGHLYVTDDQNVHYYIEEPEFIGDRLIIGDLGEAPTQVKMFMNTGNDVIPELPVVFSLNQAPPTSVSITLAASAGTYCSAYPLDFTGSNLRAYIATGFGNNSVMMTRVYKVPARTALILKGTKNTPYTIPVSGCNSQYANLLVGLVERTEVQPTQGRYTNMSLGYGNNNVLGFYPFTNAGAIGPNRAYLHVYTSTLESFTTGTAKYLRLQFDDENDSEATGINDANANGMTEGKWYNMQGVELPGIPTEKGIYIHNGKKVVFK